MVEDPIGHLEETNRLLREHRARLENRAAKLSEQAKDRNIMEKALFLAWTYTDWLAHISTDPDRLRHLIERKIDWDVYLQLKDSNPNLNMVGGSTVIYQPWDDRSGPANTVDMLYEYGDLEWECNHFGPESLAITTVFKSYDEEDEKPNNAVPLERLPGAALAKIFPAGHPYGDFTRKNRLFTHVGFVNVQYSGDLVFRQDSDGNINCYRSGEWEDKLDALVLSAPENIREKAIAGASYCRQHMFEKEKEGLKDAAFGLSDELAQLEEAFGYEE